MNAALWTGISVAAVLVITFAAIDRFFVAPPARRYFDEEIDSG